MPDSSATSGRLPTRPVSLLGLDLVPRASVPGARWPALPDFPGALMLALQFQLERTERWSPEALRAAQLRELGDLLRHAVETVPHYRARKALYAPEGDGALAEAQLARLPVLQRAEVQALGAALHSARVPAEHGPSATLRTSGSTGAPVEVLVTHLATAFNAAVVLRDHLWHRRDPTGKLATMLNRIAPPAPSWGAPFDTLLDTGPLVSYDVRLPIDDQARWLARENPTYLLTYASNARALARHCIEHQIAVPALRQVRSMGEVAREDLPALALHAWGASVVDAYSAQEVGVLALQCPEHGTYHLQCEQSLVEVLAPDGRPCRPGEVGRVVVTPLRNWAMPLVRYALLDHAEVAPPCPCGRGLPGLRRIVGRRRNMLRFPDGRSAWPSFPESVWEGIEGYGRVQIVQLAADTLRVRLERDRPLEPAQMAALTRRLTARMGYPFRVEVEVVRELPLPGGGKFEDFVGLDDEGER
ncbi:MAG: phenylacetate--CoA ligase family protein [Ectothiorhodospiraceae bacterium]|nr:phenylacetate--CoA ligase family protein [Ectothiorhodospiraceae bacterium]